MKKTIETEFKATPKELAEIFSLMDDDYQALFFSECEKQFHKFEHGKFGCEVQTWGISKHMDEDASNFIYRLGNFRKVKHFPSSSYRWNTLIDTYPQTDD